MGGIVVGHIEDKASLKPIEAEMERWNPGFKIGAGKVDVIDGYLSAERGVRHLWVESGKGQVWLPAGYRTKEGDGESLPWTYVADELGGEAREALQFLTARRPQVHPKVQKPVAAICERLRADDTFVGDIAGEVWLILESGVPEGDWTDDDDLRRALNYVIARYRDIGWTTREARDGWEPIQAGDQLIATPDNPVRVSGALRYWWIEWLDGAESHVSQARRLRHLKDTAGGCNPGFDAFRRLPLTWYANTGEGDGINKVNSHVVNIAAENSQTHFHPEVPIGGGKPQSELYFVLDPQAYHLSTAGRQPYLYAFPDLNDLTRFEEVALRPGSAVYIRPGTGHRGVDVFVNVVTLPGFKPRNEIYMDRRIKEEAGGRAPYNVSAVTA